jgi:GxxExxY protein
MKLIYEEESYQIIGAAQEVHGILGAGFQEAVYQEALAIEFENKNIPYELEKELRIKFKDRYLDKKYSADFVCFDKIIVELKALALLTNDHMAQVINYLKAPDFKLGLLINFGEKSLKVKRLAL